MSKPAKVPLHPAATVILLRDHDGQLETLLLRRNSKLAFHGGAWVFPGGRIDPGDYPEGRAGDTEAAAQRAAVREANEEAGLNLLESELVYFSHWTTPVSNPKRFSTWFFVGLASEEEVQIDGGEIHDHRWFRPNEALTANRAGDIELPAPTFVSMLKLESYPSAATALKDLRQGPPTIYTPRNRAIDGGRISIYEEDVAYESGELETPGPRHRLWMLDSGWRYEVSD